MRLLSRSTFIRLGLFAFCSAIATATFARVNTEKESQKRVKASRLKTLSKGLNLERTQRHGLADGSYTEPLLKQYKSLGVTYTRVPIILADFFDEKNPSVLKTGSLSALDAMIQMHAKIGLGIIIAPFNHPTKLYSDPALQAKFASFFKAFASHLSNTDPEIVFLEVMNEPAAPTPKDWDNIQRELIRAIRAGAPNHTIIASSNMKVTPDRWNNVGALPMMALVEDKNVVYNFHFYDPFVFTHQGATWGWRPLQFMKDIPYPSTPQALASIINNVKDSEAKGALEKYAQENWNRDKIAKLLSPVAAWAKTNGVPVTCNEFGTIPWTTPKSSRLRYLKDVREILESYHIGWGHWFKLNLEDKEAIQALGLLPLPPE